jgi:hypothetical protein
MACSNFLPSMALMFFHRALRKYLYYPYQFEDALIVLWQGQYLPLTISNFFIKKIR